MFRVTTETDKTYNKKQWRFWLTQGDSCTIRAIPKDDNGNLLDNDDIEKCRFTLADDDNVIVLEKDNLPYEDGKYVLRLTSEDTFPLDTDTYTYEFEYTLVGGEVHTPNRYKFEITDQNIE